MAFGGTELLEVCSPTPTIFGAVVGNYIVLPDLGQSTGTFTLPRTGTFTVMDTSTGDARVFTGLPTAVGNGHHSRCASHGGYAWFTPDTGTAIYRINPATGAVDNPISLSGVSGSRYGLLSCAGNLWAFRNSGYHSIYDFGTSTWASSVDDAPPGNGLSSGVTTISDRVVLAGGGTDIIRVYDAAGNELYGVTPASGSSRGGGVAIGDVAYFSRPADSSKTINVVNTSSGTGYTLSTAPYYCGANLAVGDDGWIYTYDYTTSGGAIVAVSPVTGNVQAAPPTPPRNSRTLTYNVKASPWIPSGDPR